MLLIVTAAATLLAATAPGEIADPRPQSHVVDLTGTLSASDVAAIDAEAARARDGGELLVVVVPTTSGMNPRSFTTAVFNRLGLDDKARGRGVMLMAALRDRKAEIVVGDGYADSVTSTTDSVMSGVVVARFKASDPRGAMVKGAKAIVDRVILRGAPSSATATAVDPDPTTGASRPPSSEELAAADDPIVRSVPDPWARGGIVDGARVFNKAELAELRAARAAPGGEDVVVVTASSVGGLSTRLFARGLFRRLQDTHPSPRTALLVVIAPKAGSKQGDAPPVAEVVLGERYPKAMAEATATGVSAAWYVRAANQAGRLGAATVDAARSLSSLDAELARWSAEQARVEEEEAQRVRKAAAAARSKQAALELEKRGARAARDDTPIPGGLWGLGAMALGLVGSGLGVREAVRRWPRKCKKCNVRMERLGETVDDRYLSEGEKAEERIGSVDYDLWSCPDCGDTLKRRWGALITGYSNCRACSFRTLSSTSRTLQAATQYSTGLAEVTERCAHCAYSNTYRRVIPRRPKPSSSSSSRGSSGGSSSRSSRGSSSGRGSSGSW